MRGRDLGVLRLNREFLKLGKCFLIRDRLLIYGWINLVKEKMLF